MQKQRKIKNVKTDITTLCPVSTEAGSSACCEERRCWLEKIALSLTDKAKKQAAKKYPIDLNKGYRNALYYKCAKELNKESGTHGQIALPTCVIKAIRAKYP